MPKFSVIVPIYNVEAYLERCLNSLKNQTFSDFEVLCVNDGSPANEQVIIERFVSEDSRFKGFQKTNGGLSDARNYGIERAAGDYFVFIDSDDYVSIQLLEKFNEKIEEGADYVVCDYMQVYASGADSEIISMKKSEGGSLKEHPELIDAVANCAWNKCYHRDLFMKTGIRYPKGYLYEDLGTSYVLLANAKKVSFVSEALIYYGVDRPGNISTRVDRRMFDVIAMCQKVLDDYQKMGLYELCSEQLVLLFRKNIVSSLRKVVVCSDKKFAEEFIQKCFDFLKQFKHVKKISFLSKKDELIYENRMACLMYAKLKG
ncbi:MAG: glycosyltransferase family 2 protein [Erysipelotrichaceae bacterium]|nr:glycosyltransferase family 2 protein [Erysipelotrichaceae bacterium]